MKKLRTIKPIPGIPVGSVLKKDSCCDRYSGVTPYNYSIEELEGFVEEVKEPEDYWFVDLSLEVRLAHKSYGMVAKELQFLTKSSAEKFAKALKETKSIKVQHGDAGYVFIQEDDWIGGRAEMEDLIDALNDRVK